jgi:hypothetical protein
MRRTDQGEASLKHGNTIFLFLQNETDRTVIFSPK